MVYREVIIKNRAGIHARPAAMIVQAANLYDSQIYLEKDSNRINGKSIMGIMTLGAGYNTVIQILADGKDEEEAVNTIAKLFESRFEEED